LVSAQVNESGERSKRQIFIFL